VLGCCLTSAGLDYTRWQSGFTASRNTGKTLESLKPGWKTRSLRRQNSREKQLTLTDNQIIEYIRGGDVRKYALLVDRHKDKAFTLAIRLVGNRGEADELVQDGFLRAYRSLEQFRGEAKFSTWLYRIVYNLCMTRVSRRRPQPDTVDFQDPAVENSFGEDGQQSFDLQLENQEQKEILEDEIGSLPEKYRVAVTLFYLQEMSYEEMTEILNLPLGTVKTNLFRGRNLLRERLLIRWKGELV
jgi:RNA polymerase sigma-70 factor, ECF subfamily